MTTWNEPSDHVEISLQLDYKNVYKIYMKHFSKQTVAVKYF
jgi:hypothetical protein